MDPLARPAADAAGDPLLQMTFGTITENEMIGVLFYREQHIVHVPEHEYPPVGRFRLLARRVP